MWMRASLLTHNLKKGTYCGFILPELGKHAGLAHIAHA
jgi:hypothetical protein